jgi:hypothetical protein
MSQISIKRASVASIALLTAALGCATPRASEAPSNKPISEQELALRHLQAPLDQHLCKAAVYPSARPDWRLVRVQSLAGRGTNFATALEALCREVDGQKLPAVVDIYFWRSPGGWSPNFELRGTAVRFEEGFTPPEAPAWESIKPPDMPTNLDEEPPPAGEGAKKTSSRHHGRKA